jgi:hypothetical protein
MRMEKKGKRRFFGRVAEGVGRKGCGAKGRDVEYPHCPYAIDPDKVSFVKCNHPKRYPMVNYCSVLHIFPNDKNAFHCPISDGRKK